MLATSQVLEKNAYDVALENFDLAANALELENNLRAMIKYPELVGGTERLDTILMQAAPGRIISKVGADGVWLCGVLPSDQYPSGLGIALKIADGDDLRARPVVAVAILRKLGILSSSDLAEVSPLPIKNRNGDPVGRVEAVL